MLYDLNIPWTPSASASDIELTLRFAKSLGYDVVALNQTLQGPPKKGDPSYGKGEILNPIPLLTPPTSSYPQRQTTGQPPASSTARSSTSASSSSSSPSTPKSLPTTLRRVTMVITDPVAVNYRLSEYARAFDLVAARPTNSKAFNWACTSQENAWIISMDMTASLDFHFPPKTCMAAVTRGVRFEIAYGQAIGSGDSQKRANFLGNVLGLLRATKGRGVFVSSEARSALGLRGPADVVNLLAVWGLGTDKGKEALAVVPRGVVVNEGLRRRAFRGIVDVIEGAGTVSTFGGDVEMADADEVTETSGKKQKGKDKGSAKTQQQGQKRGLEAISGGPEEASTGEQPMSKRQMKKMQKAAKKAAAVDGGS